MQIMLLYDLLEPYAVKAARTVLRGEGISNNPDLPDTGQGGTIIDFGIRYFKCSIADFLNRLSTYQSSESFSFHPPTLPTITAASNAGEKEKDTTQTGKILITDTRPLANISLINYVVSRCIPPGLAGRYCVEVDFELYGKKQTAIGFPNNAGGYELRSPTFKGSSSPKTITTFSKDSNQLTVLEGFFDFLSYEVIASEQPMATSDFLVLNSLAFFHRSREVMDQYPTVNLYLDRNKMGMACTQAALQWDKTKYIDRSSLYRHGQDLNQWLTERNSLHQESLLKKMERRRHRKGGGLRR